MQPSCVTLALQDSSEANTHPTMPEVKSTALRGNLTRNLSHRDPLLFYKVDQILGIGSMGSVARVQKRIVGGSARQVLTQVAATERKFAPCFSLPLVGNWFRHCMESQQLRKLQAYEERSESVTASIRSSNTTTTTAADSSVFYAMKSIHLNRVTDPTFRKELENEIAILKSLDHPHVVRALEVYEHRSQVFVIMELCQGGDLYTRDPYTELQAYRVIAQVVSAVSYMHGHNVCHRDVKYENILFVNKDNDLQIKLIDFGLSANFDSKNLTEGVGTM